jgi:DNA polymerase/3'-5' exonuclease PolX
MGESTINKGITIASEPKGVSDRTNTSFPDAVKELGESLHKRYPLRTSNLTSKNRKGLIKIDVLNEYTLKQFGYEFTTLKKLSAMQNERVVSVNGFGVTKLIEIVKGIQASFEQTEIPSRIANLMRR